MRILTAALLFVVIASIVAAQCIIPPQPAIVQTGNYSATANDTGKMIAMNCATACVLTLPAAIQTPNWFVWVVSIGSGQVTISPNGKTLNGSSSNTVLPQTAGAGVTISTDSYNYFYSGINPNVNFFTNISGPYAQVGAAAHGPLRSVGAVAWCVNNTATDTAALQAAITAAEGSNASGVVDVQGTCSIDGTQIKFGAHSYRYLVLNIWGVINMVNGGFKPSSFTEFAGQSALGGGGGVDNPIANIYGPRYVNVPTFELSGTEGVIFDHLGIGGGGDAPAVYLHPSAASGTIKTTIRYCSIGARYVTGTSVNSNPVRYDLAGTTQSAFGLNLIANSYGVGGTAPLPPDVYLQGIGDVWIVSPEGDFNRFNNTGIEINPSPVNIGSFNFYMGFSESTNVPDFVTVDSGGIISDLNIHNTGLSDVVGNVYLLLNKGSIINPARITGFQSGVIGILDPASTGTTLFARNDYEDYTMHNSLSTLGNAAPPGSQENFVRYRVSDLRRNGVPVNVQYANLLSASYWNLSAVTSGGGCTVAHGVRDPTGGTNAISVTCTAGKSFAPILYSVSNPSVGDVFIAGVASTASNASGLRSYVGAVLNGSGSITGTGPTFSYAGDAGAGYSNYWAFQYAVQKIKSITNPPGGSLQFQLSASDGQPASFAFPFVIKIPASANLSDAEVLEVARTFVPASPSCVIGQECDVNGPISHGTSCAMSSGTTCTATVPSSATMCVAVEQTTGAPIAGACSVSGTTATVTAASSNSATWGIVAF